MHSRITLTQHKLKPLWIVLLTAADSALRTVFARHHANRPTPMWAAEVPTPAPLSESQKAEAAALMRVNHVGEVCAQALYTAQALATRNEGCAST